MILVTGASGTNGTELIKRLSEQGVSVRDMVRRPRTHSDTAVPNVEYITADFDDSASVRRALEGIERVFLVTNSTERVEEQQLSFVDNARVAGVRSIVYLSQLHSAKDSDKTEPKVTAFSLTSLEKLNRGVVAKAGGHKHFLLCLIYQHSLLATP